MLETVSLAAFGHHPSLLLGISCWLLPQRGPTQSGPQEIARGGVGMLSGALVPVPVRSESLDSGQEGRKR